MVRRLMFGVLELFCTPCLWCVRHATRADVPPARERHEPAPQQGNLPFGKEPRNARFMQFRNA